MAKMLYEVLMHCQRRSYPELYVACLFVPVARLSRGCRAVYRVPDISLPRLHLISFVIIYFQSRDLVALRTLLAEPSQYWKAKVNL